MTTDTLPLSDRARETVQAFHREMGDRLLADIKNGTDTLSAKGDDSDPIYQAFARFEREITQSTADRVAAIDELLSTALSEAADSPAASRILRQAVVSARATLKGTDDGAE